MTITRAPIPSGQTNLFAETTQGDWDKEMSKRNDWQQSLKTVEAAKDKEEGLKARAKGKRGGDAGKGNNSSLYYEEERPSSASTRRNYQHAPSQRNPIMAGTERTEGYRPGVRQVDPPREKKAPKTHKVVNLSARHGSLAVGQDGSFAPLAGGAAEQDTGSPKGRRCFGMSGLETQPPAERPQGKAGRKADASSTVPWRFDANPTPTKQVDYRNKYIQRYGCTPETAHSTHTFAAADKPARIPNYRPSPPYSVGDN